MLVLVPDHTVVRCRDVKDRYERSGGELDVVGIEPSHVLIIPPEASLSPPRCLPSMRACSDGNVSNISTSEKLQISNIAIANILSSSIFFKLAENINTQAK